MRPGLKKPAWLAWRGDGSSGGEATQAPAGQAFRFSWSTRLLKSKKVPPLVSPPMAYSVLLKKLSAKSARAGVKVGPVVQVPGALVMSRRTVMVPFAAGMVWARRLRSDAVAP